MNLRKILEEGKDILIKNKINDAEYDATEILLNILDMDMAEFLCEEDIDLEDKYEKQSISRLISDYDELIEARSKHFPLQYILGETYFCGMKFTVDRNVLIPRADTEILVEKVISDNPDKNKFVLDLCTGSGCIAITLASLGNYKLVVGTDISDEAVRIAAKNAEELINTNEFDDEMSQRIYFLQSDLFENFEKISNSLGIETFDIITANPPYIRTKDIDKLDAEVKVFEPRIALDGADDGLRYYREIAKKAKEYMSSDGKIYLEIGYDQANDVKKIFEKEGYTHIETVKDLGKNDRVIVFKK